MRTLIIVLAAIAWGSSAVAAGIDSRGYTCAGLHALIAAKGSVFLSNPDFREFVVAKRSFCSRSRPRMQVRSVPTSDNLECPVNYCVPAPKGQ
jgi:hypothetical protein